MTLAPSVHHAPLARVTGGPLRPGGLDLTGRALDLLGLPPGAVVLDAGCGNGASLGLLAARGMRPMGIDFSTQNISAAATRNAAPLVLADAARLPLRDGACDAVLCECMLSLAPDPGAVLDEVRRVLRPGGGLALSDVYARSDAGTTPPAAPAPRCCLDGVRPRQELLALFEAHGLCVTVWEDHSPLLAHLAGQLIFAHGSLEAFWNALLPPEGARRACAAGAAARPGYYLLLAHAPSC